MRSSGRKGRVPGGVQFVNIVNVKHKRQETRGYIGEKSQNSTNSLFNPEPGRGYIREKSLGTKLFSGEGIFFSLNIVHVDSMNNFKPDAGRR